MPPLPADEDPFAAFGDDDDDDDEEILNEAPATSRKEGGEAVAHSVATILVTQLLKDKIKPSTLRITIHSVDKETGKICSTGVWKQVLRGRGFVWNDDKSAKSDIVLVDDSVSDELVRSVESTLVGGGIFILNASDYSTRKWNENIWKPLENDPMEESTSGFALVYKWKCPLQTVSCPWLPARYSLAAERDRLEQAAVFVSSLEGQQGRLLAHTIDHAVQRLERYGYCVIPCLLEPSTCLHWGQAVLSDLEAAAAILLATEQVNLLQPDKSTREPAAYRELSMREDLRMDLRHGPSLDQLRNYEGTKPWTVTASTSLSLPAANQRFLRGHPDVLEIVRRVMNPKDAALSVGNYGRYNFGGNGPDGSFQDVRVGPVGGIVSLPGSGDQAVHADTPHLFEHTDGLPAHYINAFTPGSAAHERVGQTAFVHASHRLRFCAQHATETDGWKDFLVRPMLDLGDILLFDCRILHFGIANTSNDVRRPLLYTNMTQHWFHDPKNWDDKKSIFAKSNAPGTNG